MQTLFEICCGSAEDAILAYRAGASRVELNSDLFHGGLTPTLGSLIAVKKAAPALEIMAMVRPREGGFCYTDTEYTVMKEDAQLMLEHGTDGIVFGFLHENGTVDAKLTGEFAAMAKSYGKQRRVQPSNRCYAGLACGAGYADTVGRYARANKRAAANGHGRGGSDSCNGPLCGGKNRDSAGLRHTRE